MYGYILAYPVGFRASKKLWASNLPDRENKKIGSELLMQEDDKEILNHYLYVLPKLSAIVPADYGVTLSDAATYLLYKPAKNLDLKAPVGEPIREGSAIKRAMD